MRNLFELGHILANGVLGCIEGPNQSSPMEFPCDSRAPVRFSSIAVYLEISGSSVLLLKSPFHREKKKTLLLGFRMSSRLAAS